MGKLVLVRHGTSEYNLEGLWAGWDNPALTPQGIEEAKNTGLSLKDIHFDFAYTSDQIRTAQSLEEIKKALGQDIPTTENSALRERNYGIYTKKNKWQVKKEVGEEEFQKIRRGWDQPIPQGESLKQVYEREVPYFEKEILPKVKVGKNVIIVSSGNALRALTKFLENIPDDQIALLEFGLGEAYVYDIDEAGKIVKKEIRALNSKRGKI